MVSAAMTCSKVPSSDATFEEFKAEPSRWVNVHWDTIADRRGHRRGWDPEV